MERIPIADFVRSSAEHFPTRIFGQSNCSERCAFREAAKRQCSTPMPCVTGIAGTNNSFMARR
jgi:hypothetical protein